MKTLSCLTALAFTLSLTGCSPDTSSEPSATALSQPNIDVSALLLNEEPADAQEVIAARSDAQQGDSLVVVGRIGGSKNPWVEGRAAFSLVDNSLLACSDREGDDCPYPWDYCCETDKLPTSKVFVKFVDEDGQLLGAGARELFNVKELQTVVIRGTAQCDDAGNLTVLASGMFVRN